ncbi:MAG: hypothetical protein IE884_02245 [Sulfuricurvum sp.]|nr:hypothetical protein [Sulfuricurvum sp.]
MKKFWYLLYVIVVMIVLIPKKELYFSAEALLQKDEFYLSGETLSAGWFWQDIEHVRVLSGMSALAEIERIRIVPWIVVNDLYFDSIKAVDGFALFFPGQIERARLRYALWNPLNVSVDIDGDFGHAQGSFNLSEGKLLLYFDALPQMRRYPLLVSKLRSQGEKLVYERTF